MASQTMVKGTHSQLLAASALLANGYIVSEPLATDTMDFVVRHPETNEWLTAQVKTIFLRTDKKSDYYVVFSRKGDKTAYTEDEIDVIIGVYNGEVYLIRNNGQQEYWSKPEQAPTKWEKIDVLFE